MTTSNQLSATGFSYDPAGNMLTDAVNSYAYNAEGEIKSATGVSYTYDGDGDRVEKSSGKLYWYGVGSQILDESTFNGSITDEYIFFGGKRIAHRDVNNNVYYYAEDFLGSTRTLVEGGATAPCYDADFYPYGGERDITTTCSQNYKYETKERDTETGNDDFGARYYNSRLGRWLSADWSAIPAPVPYANLANPQTLNLYAMVSDNTETFADLNGHYVCGTNCRGMDDVQIGGSGDTGWAGDFSPDDSPDSDLNARGATQIQIKAVDWENFKADAEYAVAHMNNSAGSNQLSWKRVDDKSDAFVYRIQWHLSEDSAKGGWIVQHVVGDWNSNSDNSVQGHQDYWEAWFVNAKSSMTLRSKSIKFDDQFSGGFGTKIHADARFYEGLHLPAAFKAGAVPAAGGLRSVYNTDVPQLPTIGSNTVTRDWKP